MYGSFKPQFNKYQASKETTMNGTFGKDFNKTRNGTSMGTLNPAYCHPVLYYFFFVSVTVGLIFVLVLMCCFVGSMVHLGPKRAFLLWANSVPRSLETLGDWYINRTIKKTLLRLGLAQKQNKYAKLAVVGDIYDKKVCLMHA